MGSRAAKTKLKELETRCAQLERQAQQLQEEKQRAAYTEQLLNFICDIFTMMQISSGLRGVDMPDDVPKHSRDRVNELLQQESSLLSQLPVVPRQPVPEALGVPILGVSTAAPKADPLALMKYTLCQDVAEAGTITSQQIAQRLSATVLEGSVQLHLLQRPDVPAAQACIDRLRELWLDYLSLMTAVMLAGRPEVIEGVNTYNLSTLQPDPQAMQQQHNQDATLPGLLDLTDDQVQDIIAGAPVFKKLQESIVREEQQLLRAGLGAVRSTPSDSGSSHGNSSVCSMHNGSRVSGSSQELSLQAILGDLEQHMRYTDRLKVLLHKDLTMRALTFAWLAGSLDWRQITKAAILCWPYVCRLSVSTFAQAVSEYAERRRLQQGEGQAQEQAQAHSSS